MTRLSEFYSMDAAFVVFVVLFLSSRVMLRSALKLLDNEAKVRLVDASARSGWWYVPLLAIFALLYWRLLFGGIALGIYVLAAMAFNAYWLRKNRFPEAYVSRVVIANVITLVALSSLALGYLAETA